MARACVQTERWWTLWNQDRSTVQEIALRREIHRADPERSGRLEFVSLPDTAPLLLDLAHNWEYSASDQRYPEEKVSLTQNRTVEAYDDVDMLLGDNARFKQVHTSVHHLATPFLALLDDNGHCCPTTSGEQFMLR